MTYNAFVDVVEGLPIISYLPCVFADMTSLILLRGGEKKFRVFLYGLRARSAMAQDKILRPIALATFLVSPSLFNTHMHARAHTTHSRGSHAARPLQQAPTSKPSPFSAVTSRVAMATPAPPQSGAELTCLTAYI